MRKKIFFLVVVLFCFLGIQNVYAKTAYSIGTYYGIWEGDFRNLANKSAEAFYKMGYDSYYNHYPTYEYLSGVNPSTGRYRMESEISFFAGHGDKNHIDFAEGKKSVSTNFGIFSGSSYDNYVGLANFNLSNVKLMIFAACFTGQGDGANLMNQAVQNGASSSIGWSTDVSIGALDAWTTNFYSKLQEGKNIKDAYDYAQSKNYSDSNAKNARLWGIWETTVSSQITGPHKISELDTIEYKVSENLSKNPKSDIIMEIATFIKNNYIHDFNLNDYIAEITPSTDLTYYMFIKKLNGVRTDEYCQVIVKNNQIIAFQESSKKIGSNPSANLLTDNDIEKAKQESMEYYKLNTKDIIKQDYDVIYESASDKYILYIYTTIKDNNGGTTVLDYAYEKI